MILELRDHGFDDLVDSRLLSFLNDTYYEFCSLEVWPFLETSTAALTTTANNSVLTLPADVRAVLSIVNTTTGNTLSPERRATIVKRFARYLTQVGEPSFYYRIGPAWGVYPVPGSAYNLLIDYVKRPAALTTVITGGLDSTPIFPVDHHRVLVLGALARANNMEDDSATGQYYDGLYAAKVDRIRNDLWGWQYDRPDRLIDLFDNDAFDY